MTSTTAPTAPAAKWPIRATAHISHLLAEQARSQRTDADYYRHALALLAGWIDAPLAAIDIRLGAKTLELHYESEQADPQTVRALWEVVSEAPPLAGDRGGASHAEDGLIVLRVPLQHPRSGTVGSVIAVVTARGRTPNQWLREVQSLAALAVAHRAAARPPATSDAVSPLMRRAAECKDLREFADPFVARLASRLRCDRVALGVVDGGRVRLTSATDCSGPGELPEAPPLRDAMQACLDARRSVACQPQARGDDRELGGPEHQACQQVCGGSLLTTPVRVGSRITAVLSFQRSAEAPFRAGDIEWAEATAAGVAPAVELLKRTETGAWGAGKRGLRLARRMAQSKRCWWTAGAALLTVLIAVAAFSRHPYQLQFTGQLSADFAAVQAPQSGSLRMLVQSGETVVAGQVVAELLDQPLADDEWSRRQAALREQLVGKLNEAERLATQSPQLASLAQAEAAAIQSELNGLAETAAPVLIHSPVAGTVQRISADPLERVSEGELLVRIAEPGLYLAPPPSVAAKLQPGTAVRLVPAGGPPRQLRVKELRSLLGPDGKPQVLAEVTSDDPLAAAPAAGEFQVDLGTRPLWWLTVARLLGGR